MLAERQKANLLAVFVGKLPGGALLGDDVVGQRLLCAAVVPSSLVEPLYSSHSATCLATSSPKVF